MAARPVATCALCHGSYGSGLEPAAGSDIWRARKMLRQRSGQPPADAGAAVDAVWSHGVAHFVAAHALRDLRRIDDSRQALRTTIQHRQSASLVVRHAAGSVVDTTVERLHFLPSDVNRVLAIRPSTAADSCGSNLRRQQQREVRPRPAARRSRHRQSRSITRQERESNRCYYEARLALMRSPVSSPTDVLDRQRLLGRPPGPAPGVTTVPYKSTTPPILHVNAGTLVETSAGRCSRLEVRWPTRPLPKPR
ncbi:hypothetical protein ACHHYP_09063 [Achlya hypogyna]|uniref:Uncharacterized protein n=1 Tax=Achlya hypogyna TaxID=1202772 RepID=A0A1V9ZJR8_ACHHY|nr:hypothetical protein ACHHYP_09063 [Achlya hypogyna]